MTTVSRSEIRTPHPDAVAARIFRFGNSRNATRVWNEKSRAMLSALALLASGLWQGGCAPTTQSPSDHETVMEPIHQAPKPPPDPVKRAPSPIPDNPKPAPEASEHVMGAQMPIPPEGSRYPSIEPPEVETGVTTIRICVDAKGHPIEIVVIKPSGNSSRDAAVVNWAASRRDYMPKQIDGVSLPKSCLILPVEWTLESPWTSLVAGNQLWSLFRDCVEFWSIKDATTQLIELIVNTASILHIRTCDWRFHPMETVRINMHAQASNSSDDCQLRFDFEIAIEPQNTNFSETQFLEWHFFDANEYQVDVPIVGLRSDQQPLQRRRIVPQRKLGF
jgi:hypothetical protein